MAAPRLTLEQALARVLAAAAPLPAETVPFAQAAGRVLAEPLLADRDDPPGPKSAMDGFALRAADTRGAAPERPQAFRWDAVLAAGRAPDRALPPSVPGAAEHPALRIMTGALLPAGADAVVKQEDTERGADGRFRLRRPLAPGEHVIPRGARMEQGERLLPAGARLGPQALGILAAAHWPGVRVHRRPAVALLALGDELLLPGEPLAPGRIPVTNLHVLAGLVARYGGLPRSLGVAPDDPDRILDLLRPCLGGGDLAAALRPSGSAAPDGVAGASVQGSACDLVITLGGSHGGDFDFVHAVLERAGAELRFDRVGMTPGGSTVFATHGPTLLFGLPGTPSASWTAFEVLVRPALARLAGETRAPGTVLRARLAAPLPPGSAPSTLAAGSAPGHAEAGGAPSTLAAGSVHAHGHAGHQHAAPGLAAHGHAGHGPSTPPAGATAVPMDDRVQFFPCRLDLGGAEPLATPIAGRHPHEAPATPPADGIVRCPAHETLPQPGDWVSVLWVAD